MQISTILQDLANGVGASFVAVIKQISTIFFTETEGNVKITGIGYIAMIGLVLSFIYFALRWITGLFRQRR